jgi:hypothetical protein
MFQSSQLSVLRMVWAITLVFTLSPGLAPAEDFSKFCSETQSFLNQNQPLLAIGVLQKAMDEVWNSVPLHVEKAVLVKEKAKGYGQYDARPNNVYKSGEIIILYVEPVGLTRKKEGDHYLSAGAADFMLAREDGTILGGKENFSRWENKLKIFGTHDYMDFDYKFTGLKPGTYVIKTVLRDLIGSKIASVTTPVRIE